LIWKAKETQGPTLLELASEINTRIPNYVVGKVMDVLSQEGIPSKQAKVLLLGVAFKKDVSDIREAPSLQVMKELQKKGVRVFYHDPHVKALSPVFKSIRWDVKVLACYDCVVILTDHTFYPWKLIAKEAKSIIDTRNVMAPFPQFQQKVVKA
ncbi:MAG: hypothetical protein FJZ58_08140, partial [Chlamydiae bacterium]|nr:hypothetical protein [Chlamydiota bacterium]